MDITKGNINKTGVSYIKKGALFAIAGVILSVPVYVIDFLFLSDISAIMRSEISFSSYTSKMPASSHSIFYAFIIISLAGLMLSILSIVNYRNGFRLFNSVDKRFSRPFLFSKYVIIFYIILIIVFILLLLFNAGRTIPVRLSPVNSTLSLYRLDLSGILY